MFKYLRSIALQQFQTLDENTRLVIIHPNYVHQHLFLAEFLDDSAAYVRFEGQNLTLKDLQDQLKSAIKSQFGSESNSFTILLLDECDRAEQEALNTILSNALSEFPNSKIIAFSREIPYKIIEDEALRVQTSFIPNNPSLMMWNYPRIDTETHLLEVRSLGEGRVLLNGKNVDNWDGILPRSLFFYMVDRGMTTRNEIFETFWPTLSTREATNVFHVTKRKISEVLGLDLTTYWSGFYRISPNIELSYDVILFTELVQNSAIASGEEAILQLTNAIELYQGQFLYGMDMNWAHHRRSELNEDYSESIASLAELKEQSGHKPEALGLYLRAAANSPQREDLASNIMRLYREMGMHKDALVVYDRLKVELKKQLSVSPNAQLDQLATEIRREMA